MSAVLPANAAPPRLDTPVERPIVDPKEPSAAERLEASRARLRTALMAIAHPPPKPSLLDDIGISGFGSQILEKLKSLPGAALVMESIEHWWAEHPLHAAGALAEEASRRYVGPIARRNPVAVVLGSAIFGALLVASKPWRWLLRPALFIGLVPQIASHALKRMPLDSWLQMLSTLSGKRPAPAGAAAAGTAAAAATAKPAPVPDPASRLPTNP
jgi:hypothetical protein